MKSLGDLIQYDRCPQKKRKNAHTYTLKKDHVKTQGEDNHLPAREKGLRINHPCRHGDLRFPASRLWGNIYVCCLCHPVCCPLLLQPSQTDTDTMGLFTSVLVAANMVFSDWPAGAPLGRSSREACISAWHFVSISVSLDPAMRNLGK